MKDCVIIDKIYASLLDLCHDPDYNFDRFRGSWGYRNSERYQDKLLDFISCVQRLAKNVPVKYYAGNYFMFDGKIYVPVRKDLVGIAFDQLLEYLRIAVMIGNRTVRDRFMRTVSYYNLLEPRPDLVAFTNGVLDLRTHLFNPFSADYHVIYYHPYAYDPKAKCTKWQNFLHEVLPDKNSRIILQMFLGLGLMERASVYNPYEGKESSKVELCLILIGAGSNGKSTIYNTALGIFGKERISGLDYDDLTAPGDEGMRARTLLRDALFNWSSDSDQRTFGRKRTGVFKRIVSGESVTDRRIGENVRENYNIPFLIFNLNELPYSDDESLGFIRRLQFISFEYIVPKKKQNPALSQELVKEYPGIFNWVMRGCKELKRRKFVFPSSKSSRRQTLLAQLNVNPVAAWVNAYRMRYEPRAPQENGVWIPTSTLLDSLNRFCDENGAPSVTKQFFGQRMARMGKGFTKEHRGDGNYYLVYGCNSERLREPFKILDEDFDVDYVEQKGSFIGEDD